MNNEEDKMAGWTVALLGFALWSLLWWSIGRWWGWAQCYITAYNRGWEDREKVENYIDRSTDDELRSLVVSDGR